MTTLFVIRFLALLWNAGLTLAVIGAVRHPRHTRGALRFFAGPKIAPIVCRDCADQAGARS